eukprot:m51a1_g1637 putative rab gtpase (218) ;mRNA; r:304047-305416
MEIERHSDDAKKHLYKVLVIGDYAVGKTSLIKRYCEGYFTPNYKLTIGVDFAVKNIRHMDTDVTLQLWDIAGHERFGTMTRVYYKYAIAAIIVYDVQRPSTFDAVLKWKEDVDTKVELPSGERIPCMLLANKCDTNTPIDSELMDKFARDNGFVGWFPTSALSDTNIDKAMMFMVDHILEVSKNFSPERPKGDVSLEEPAPVQRRGCCFGGSSEVDD